MAAADQEYVACPTCGLGMEHALIVAATVFYTTTFGCTRCEYFTASVDQALAHIATEHSVDLRAWLARQHG